MAETFTGNIKFSLAGTLTGDNDLSTVSQAFNYAKSFALTNGTAINQANMIFADRRTIAASGVDDLDLSGALVNSFGTTINFTTIKGIIISADSSNTGQVILGGTSSNNFFSWSFAAGNRVRIVAGGMIALINPTAAGYAVTAGTADILQISNTDSGSSVTYDIILIGEV